MNVRPLADVRPAPRWAFRGRLFQPRQPAFWLFAGLLLVAGDRSIGIQAALAQAPSAFVTSWLLVLLYAVPVALVVYRLDLFEREPLVLLAAALVWGGVIATGLAVTANDAWSSVLGKVAPGAAVDWTAALVAPPVEETLKLMGVVVLWLIVPEEFDGALDGFVYGAMVGLGFTMVEDVMYFVSPVLSSGVDGTSSVFDGFFIRVIGGGLYGHVVFAGLSGMGFAYFVTSQASFGRRLAGFLGCLAAALAAHAFWDAPLLGDLLSNGGAAPTSAQILLWCTAKGLPSLLLLTVLVVLATRTEERTFRELVAGEPDPSLFPEDEVRALGSLWSRRAARLAAGRRQGRRGSSLVGELQSAQVEYARVRSGASSPDDPELERLRQRIRMTRSAIAALPDRATGGRTRPFAAAADSRSGASSWSPTHAVPPGGVAAWSAPDPKQRPATWIAPGTPLAVEARLGDWALARAASGWRGWVDGRLLMDGR